MSDVLSSLFSLAQPREGPTQLESGGSETEPAVDLDFSSAFAKAFSRLQAERQADAAFTGATPVENWVGEPKLGEPSEGPPEEFSPPLQQVALSATLTVLVPAQQVPDEDLATFAQSQGIALGTLAQLQGRTLPAVVSPELPMTIEPVLAEGRTLPAVVSPERPMTIEPVLVRGAEGEGREVSINKIKVSVVQAQWRTFLDRQFPVNPTGVRQESATTLAPLDLSEFSELFEGLPSVPDAPTRRVASTQAYLSSSGFLAENFAEGAAPSSVQTAGEGAGAGLGQGQMSGETARMLAQQLSQKFGELMSQRLIQQIQQGHWKVELELHPADLGPIEVELNWNGGELEAIFRAVHGTTRDLLQENLPKLRSVLEQSGTDVAYLGVGPDQRQHSGGQQAGRDARQHPVPSAPEAALEQKDRVSSHAEGLSIWV